MLTYSVHGVRISKIADEEITSGSIGVKVKFIFDDTWTPMSKVAIFKVDDYAVDVIVPMNGSEVEIDIPAKVLENANYLKVGLYGTVGELATPTIWSDSKTIKLGAIPSGVNAPVPDTLVQQILALANDAKTTATT